MAESDVKELELAYYEGETRDYIDRHFSDPEVSVDDLSAFLGVSTRTLTRKLEARDCSWTGLLFERRLQEAERLLREPDSRTPIRDIARACGYSKSAFEEMCLQQFKATPAAYRQSHGGPARTPRRRRGASQRPSRLVLEASRREARHRLEDQAWLRHHGGSPTPEEIQTERDFPTRMRKAAPYWRLLRKRLDQWIETNNAAAPSSDDDTPFFRKRLGEEEEKGAADTGSDQELTT